jgi:hypothetical protein
MSAFGGKADIFGSKATVANCHFMSALGVKRTWQADHRMSAYDPKRTLGLTSV